jgi:hypothetical protein
MSNATHNKFVYGRTAICRFLGVPVSTFRNWEAEPALREMYKVDEYVRRIENGKLLSTERELSQMMDTVMKARAA